MSNVITMFSAPIREFKTKKAAEKYSKRIIGGAHVKVINQSFYDYLAPKRKYYGVFQGVKTVDIAKKI